MIKKARKYKLLTLLLLLSLALFAQEEKRFEGVWGGVVTQQMGYSTEYGMELYLKQEGSIVTGRSYVYVDSIYAEMVIEGKVLSDTEVLLTDIEIIEDEIIDEMEWCVKTYQLRIRNDGDVWHLEGKWEGKTSFSSCVPGEVKLKKVVPRA